MEIIKTQRERPRTLNFKVSPVLRIRAVSQEETHRSPLVKTMLWFTYSTCSRGGSVFLCILKRGWTVTLLSLWCYHALWIVVGTSFSDAERHGHGEATNAATPQPLRVDDNADMLWLWSGSQKGPHGALFHLPFVKCYEIYGCREEQKWKHCTPSSYFPY